MVVVPLVVHPETPPNELLLFHWSCPDDPPGVLATPHPEQDATVSAPADVTVAFVDPKLSVPAVADTDRVAVPLDDPLSTTDPATPLEPSVRAPVDNDAFAKLPDGAAPAPPPMSTAPDGNNADDDSAVVELK
jgi:hypothetical protein